MVLRSTEKVVEQAVNWFRRRWTHNFDFHEASQQARLIAFATVTAEPEKSRNPAYLFSAVRRSLGNYLSQQIAVVSIKGNWSLGRQYVHREPLTRPANDTDGSRDVGVAEERFASSDPGPEERLLRQEERRQHLHWRVMFRRAVDRVMRGMDEVERDIVERRFGLDDQPAETCQSIVTSLYRQGIEIDVHFVYSTLERVTRRLRDSLELAVLEQRLEELRR